MSLFGSTGFSETKTQKHPSPVMNGTVENTSLAEKSQDMSAQTRDKLISLLSTTPIDLDEIIRESGEDPADIHLLILELELANKLIRHAGNQVSLI